MTSARMKPRWMSVWIRPAHSGAFDPARNVQARVSLSPVVRNVRRPSRWYAERTIRNRAPSPEPEALEHLGALVGIDDRRRLGLELHAHADHLDVVAGRRELGAHALLDLGDGVELVLADVDDGQHRPVGQQEVRGQLLLPRRP